MCRDSGLLRQSRHGPSGRDCCSVYFRNLVRRVVVIWLKEATRGERSTSRVAVDPSGFAN